MKRNLTVGTSSVAAALLLSGTPGVGHAQQASEVEALKSQVATMDKAIAEMNRKIAELEKTSASTEAKIDAAKSGLAEETTQVPLEETMRDEQSSAPRSGNAPLDPSYKGFAQIGGTNTWFKIGGYAKLDSISDSTKVGNPNSFLTSLIPVQGETDYGKGQHYALHAKQTRINFELRAPTPLGSLKIFYENDFFNNSNQPSMDYRLRHFYGQVANITVGQTWSTFLDVDVIPDTLDFEGPGSLPVSRTPQFRYTIPLVKDSMHLAFAAEQPKGDIYNVPTGGDTRNTMPDFVAQWRWTGAPGHIQAAAVLRELAYDNVAGGTTDSTAAWGLNVSGTLKVLGADSVLASVSYGDGMGRYVQDLPSGSGAVIDANGNLQTLTTSGWMLGYRHIWSTQLRSTASYSYVQLDNRAEQGGFAYDNTNYLQANLIWAPSNNMYLGLEYIYGDKETRNGNTGDASRLQFSFQYKLVR